MGLTVDGCLVVISLCVPFTSPSFILPKNEGQLVDSKLTYFWGAWQEQQWRL